MNNFRNIENYSTISRLMFASGPSDTLYLSSQKIIGHKTPENTYY